MFRQVCLNPIPHFNTSELLFIRGANRMVLPFPSEGGDIFSFRNAGLFQSQTISSVQNFSHDNENVYIYIPLGSNFSQAVAGNQNNHTLPCACLRVDKNGDLVSGPPSFQGCVSIVIPGREGRLLQHLVGQSGLKQGTKSSFS